MYLSRRMQGQGLAEVLQIYNKVERKTSTNPCRSIVELRRDYCNQKSPRGIKLSNPFNAAKYFSNYASNNSKMQSSSPNPWFNFPSWGRWMIGSVISLVISFWNDKRMQRLKRIQGEAELAVQGVEAVAEMVEKVATATEEMAEEMVEKLPEKSKMKQVALVVQHISEVAAHEAHLTEDFLHKVEKVTQDVDDLEAMIDKIVANAETKQQQPEEANSGSGSPSRH